MRAGRRAHGGLWMQIELLAAGTRPPAWIREGFNEYQKRFTREWMLQLQEVPIARRTRNNTREKLKDQEGERMLSLVKPDALIVAMDRTGAQMTTEQLAKCLDGWQRDFRRLQLVIGGPDGLSKGCLDAATSTWSLSLLTFPHFLVRILVAEQLYRAWSVLKSHPYHK